MKEVLKKIKPSKKEREEFYQKVESFVKKITIKIKDAKVILGGSCAKDTWLSGNHDVDIFVQYKYDSYKSQSDKLSDLLEKSLKQALPKIEISRVHGSRDYFQLRFENLEFEIVPILEINESGEAVNITDISPLHSIWVNANTEKIKDEIRLAKQFCKANKLYGAESYIGGFSGYVLEIMLAYYGSFENLLNASLKWKDKTIIDPEKYYKAKEALFHINNSKLVSPIIVVDPVDKYRNASAALSEDKFKLFKKVAKQYLKSPSADFFVKKELDLNEIKEKNFVYLEVESVEGKKDVVGAKMLKIFNFLEKELTKFTIKKSAWEFDKKNKAVFYFKLGKNKLPEFEVRKGPPLNFKKHVETFKKKNKNNYEKSGFIYAKIKLKHTNLEDYVDNLIKKKYLTEKIKEIKNIILQ